MLSPIIFSGPPVFPPVPRDQWETITVEWVGRDGSVWDLASGAQGVVLQAQGTEGLHDPVLTRYVSEARAVHGNRIRGWRAPARSVFWPILIYSDVSDEWVDTYDRFFDSIHEEQSGTWRVGFRGEVRELNLTAVYDRGQTLEADGKHPTVFGWSMHGVYLEASQPFWRGQTIKRGPWRAPDSVEFFGEDGAPDFHIGEASAFGSATIANPGDVDAYVVWEARDQLEEISVGVADAVIEVPFSIADGEMLRIDTDLRNPTAALGPVPDGDAEFQGDDVTEDLGLQPFGPVAPGASQELHVEATGSGAIFASLTPLYKRAIGRRQQR